MARKGPSEFQLSLFSDQTLHVEQHPPLWQIIVEKLDKGSKYTVAQKTADHRSVEVITLTDDDVLYSHSVAKIDLLPLNENMRIGDTYKRTGNTCKCTYVVKLVRFDGMATEFEVCGVVLEKAQLCRRCNY